MIWWILGTFFIISVSVISWSILNAPMMKDDYDL